jgi:hypothetical protein
MPNKSLLCMRKELNRALLSIHRSVLRWLSLPLILRADVMIHLMQMEALKSLKGISLILSLARCILSQSLRFNLNFVVVVINSITHTHHFSRAVAAAGCRCCREAQRVRKELNFKLPTDLYVNTKDYQKQIKRGNGDREREREGKIPFGTDR